jgi:Na+/H+-dicarboxylate symporter
MLPMLMMIGTLIDPPATMINATGDTNAAMLISRAFEGSDWYRRAVD